MRVWLLTIGEPLPIDGGDPRIMRTGLLARELTARGHQVLWWSARFDHTGKRHRRGPAKQHLADGTKLRLLRSCGYTSNISTRRWIDHVLLALAFLLASAFRRRPDVVVASLPPPELALVATLRCRGAYRIVDVRDKWPDVLSQTPPSGLKRVGAAVMSTAARGALRRAEAIWASAETFLVWALENADRGRASTDAVIPHGYDAPAERPGPRSSEGPIQIVFAGALTDWFDLDTVMRALLAFNTPTLRAQLTICGAGPHGVRLQAVANEREDVKMAGFLDRASLWKVLSGAQIGIAPYIESGSLDDSLPNKIIEYCAAGLAVCTSIRGSARELILTAKAGFAYDNSDELSALLESAIADRSMLARTGQNAAALFEANFVASQVYGEAVERISSLPCPDRNRGHPYPS